MAGVTTNGRAVQILGADGRPFRPEVSVEEAQTPPRSGSPLILRRHPSMAGRAKRTGTTGSMKPCAIPERTPPLSSATASWVPCSKSERTVMSLRRDLEVPDDNDEKQKFVRDTIKAAVKSIPEFYDLTWCLLEAIWYGKYGVQVAWGWRWFNGVKTWIPLRWEPVHGDKFGYQYQPDGGPDVPYILVFGGALDRLKKRGGQIITTTNGLALLLDRHWRGASSFTITRSRTGSSGTANKPCASTASACATSPTGRTTS